MLILEDMLGSRVNVTLLRYLTAIKGGLSGNEIATRLGLRQSSVRQALERLVATGAVKRTDIGRTAAYEVDHELASTRSILVPLFQAEAKLRDDLINRLIRDCKKLSPQPRAVMVFGSLARGERQFRDVDLLCVVAKKTDKRKLHDALLEKFQWVQNDYRLPVSAIVAAESELSTTKLSALVREVRRDGLLLSGTSLAAFTGMKIWNT